MLECPTTLSFDLFSRYTHFLGDSFSSSLTSFKCCVLRTSRFISPAQPLPWNLDSNRCRLDKVWISIRPKPELSAPTQVFPFGNGNSSLISLKALGPFLPKPVWQQILLVFKYIPNLATSQIHFTTKSAVFLLDYCQQVQSQSSNHSEPNKNLI